jgi:DNA uptake protein ComE-like DNA-binding protein
MSLRASTMRALGGSFEWRDRDQRCPRKLVRGSSLFKAGRTLLRGVPGLSALAAHLAMAGFATAALAQTPPLRPHEPTPPASQTEPWLEELPARRGLEPRPRAFGGNGSGAININTATPKELTRLKDIGRARANDIIKGRPYSNKDDLVERDILPRYVYDEIKNSIVAGQE